MYQTTRSPLTYGMRTLTAAVLAAAALTLTACGSQDAPETSQQVAPVAVQTEAPEAEVSETAQPETTAGLGEAVEVADDVAVSVVEGRDGSYAVQVQASPSLAGSWTVPVDDLVGVTADGSTVEPSSSQWPANPTVTSADSIIGGTVTFPEPVVAIRYAASDGSVTDWSVS